MGILIEKSEILKNLAPEEIFSHEKNVEEDEKYQDLQKKIDRAERILKQKQIKEKKEKKHKDTHCKNCIPTRYSS